MAEETQEKTLYVYVDESGSITKTNISNNRYFVIAMVFTDDPIEIRRLYKKKISQMMRKNDKYKDMIQTYLDSCFRNHSRFMKGIYEVRYKKVKTRRSKNTRYIFV